MTLCPLEKHEVCRFFEHFYPPSDKHSGLAVIVRHERKGW